MLAKIGKKPDFAGIPLLSFTEYIIHDSKRKATLVNL